MKTPYLRVNMPKTAVEGSVVVKTMYVGDNNYMRRPSFFMYHVEHVYYKCYIFLSEICMNLSVEKIMLDFVKI